MSKEEKNKISHRGQAMQLFRELAEVKLYKHFI
jgi:inosine/xanthosine triphosphate pyrophosphatase family protein